MISVVFYGKDINPGPYKFPEPLRVSETVEYALDAGQAKLRRFSVVRTHYLVFANSAEAIQVVELTESTD